MSGGQLNLWDLILSPGSVRIELNYGHSAGVRELLVGKTLPSW